MKRIAFLPVVVALALPAAASAQAGAPQEKVPTSNLPLKHAAKPTVAAITPADLMTRLYIFADDSMGGRPAGTKYNDMGTDYIASEAKRLGMKPMGDNGTYFQSAHLFIRAMDSASTITVDGKTYHAGTDFLANVPNQVAPGDVQMIYGGLQLDTANVLTEEQVAGKILVLGPRDPNFKQPADIQAFIATNGYKGYLKMIQSAAGTTQVGPATFSAGSQKNVFAPAGWGFTRVALKGDKPLPPNLTLSGPVMEAVFGGPIAGLKRGALGKPIAHHITWHDTEVPGRNVVAVIPGSDPKLKNEYIVIGAHNDHVPMSTRAVDHDSLRAYNSFARPGGAETQPPKPVTPENWVRVNAMKDSLRALHGGMRLDSINNGADDDGSGSMAVLEIAENFAKSAVKPKRSLLFVWHVGEERGMFGSNYFTDYPTVPRDSIVGALNVDMIGRGDLKDSPEIGGPQYLQLLGSRRLSAEYGDLVEKVITDTKSGFKVDYQFDANGHPQQYYCRSDHWAYARYGIPVTFFSTGGHQDYHQLTDEPQYIDYYHYARVAQLIHDVASKVANLDHKLAITGERGDPYRECVQ